MTNKRIGPKSGISRVTIMLGRLAFLARRTGPLGSCYGRQQSLRQFQHQCRAVVPRLDQSHTSIQQKEFNWQHRRDNFNSGRTTPMTAVAAAAAAVVYCSNGSSHLTEDERLLRSAHSGNASDVVRLVGRASDPQRATARVSPDARHSLGWTALQVASVRGNRQVVR